MVEYILMMGRYRNEFFKRCAAVILCLSLLAVSLLAKQSSADNEEQKRSSMSATAGTVEKIRSALD